MWLELSDTEAVKSDWSEEKSAIAGAKTSISWDMAGVAIRDTAPFTTIRPVNNRWATDGHMIHIVHTHPRHHSTSHSSYRRNKNTNTRWPGAILYGVALGFRPTRKSVQLFENLLLCSYTWNIPGNLAERICNDRFSAPKRSPSSVI